MTRDDHDTHVRFAVGGSLGWRFATHEALAQHQEQSIFSQHCQEALTYRSELELCRCVDDVNGIFDFPLHARKH